MITDKEINERLAERYRTGRLGMHLLGIGRDGLLDLWRKFIEEVEAGYRSLIEEYWNDLDARDIIEDCHLGDDPEVVALDKRLQALLIHTDKLIWNCECENAFWVWGYPKNVSEDLKKDFDRTSF